MILSAVFVGLFRVRLLVAAALIGGQFGGIQMVFADDDRNTGEPRIQWIFPAEGERVVGRQFVLNYNIAGDPAGALSTLRFARYNIGPLGTASPIPDLLPGSNTGGTQFVNLDELPDLATPGIYEACAVLLNAARIRIAAPSCVTFRVVFSGIDITTPLENDVLTAYSGNALGYSIFGEPGIVAVSYSVDGGPELIDSASSGEIALQALTEGRHTVRISGLDENGYQYGDSDTVTFSLHPPLSYEKIQDIQLAAIQSLNALPAERQAILAVVYPSLIQMARLNPKEKNPAFAYLDTKHAKKLLAAYQSAYRHVKSKRYKRYAQKVFRLTEKMLKPRRTK